MYRNTDLPDSTIVQVSLSIGQIRIVDRLVSKDLQQVEFGSGENVFEENELQRLNDVLWPILKIEMSREERIERLKGIWTQDEIDRAIEIGAL